MSKLGRCWGFAAINTISLCIYSVSMAVRGFLGSPHEEKRLQWLLGEFCFHRYLLVVLAFKHWAKYQCVSLIANWTLKGFVLFLFFSLQHSLPPSAYATVKAYSNFDADRDAAALETAIKTKGGLRAWLAKSRARLGLNTNILISLLKDTYFRRCCIPWNLDQVRIWTL